MAGIEKLHVLLNSIVKALHQGGVDQLMERHLESDFEAQMWQRPDKQDFEVYVASGLYSAIKGITNTTHDSTYLLHT